MVPRESPAYTTGIEDKLNLRHQKGIGWDDPISPINPRLECEDARYMKVILEGLEIDNLDVLVHTRTCQVSPRRT